MRIDFVVNGDPVSLEVMADELLVDVLRDRLGLTGTKLTCGEGECGACTVWLDESPVCSCILPIAKVEGRAITTIEGLANSEIGRLLQERMAQFGASQCGYCSPGFVMAAAALLRDHPEASRAEIIRGLEGNLCRCTGYTRIVAAVESTVDPSMGIPLPDSV